MPGFPRGKRSSLESASGPGPGEYHDPTAVFSTRGTTFGNPGAAREEISGDAGLYPGPGEYEPRMDPTPGGRWSRGEARPEERGDEGPGPGGYEVGRGWESSSNARRVKGAVVYGGGVRLEADGEDDEDKITPGPGDYDIPPAADFPDYSGRFRDPPTRTAAQVMGTKATPGPGHYSIEALVPSTRTDNLAGKTFARPMGAAGGSRASVGDGHVTPGPGDYDVPSPRRGPAYVINAHDRETTTMPTTKKYVGTEKQLHSYPGPGAYRTEGHTGAATRVGKKTATGLSRKHQRFLDKFREGAIGGGGGKAPPEGHPVHQRGFKTGNTTERATLSEGSSYQAPRRGGGGSGAGGSGAERGRESYMATADSGDVAFSAEEVRISQLFDGTNLTSATI